jgi:Zn-dependent protease with chaperone function
MSSASPVAHRPSTRQIRHPAEIPFFVLMVVLNIAIIVFILRAAVVVPFLPEGLQDSGVATAIRTALIALLLLIPGLIVVRETQRAGVRGTAVQLSPHQYPELYGTAQDFAQQLGLRRRPDIFLANGNGALNAFAAQATGHDYVVLSNELFANLYQNNRDGQRFIIGHEMGHIRLHHVALWYQFRLPIPSGSRCWRSHPFTVRRLERLHSLGLLTHDGRPEPAQPSPEPVMPAG